MSQEEIQEARALMESIISSEEFLPEVKLERLQELESAKYNALLRGLVYKRDIESARLLVDVFMDLGFLTHKLSEYSEVLPSAIRDAEVTSRVDVFAFRNINKSMDSKIKYLTDSAVLYEHAITIIEERLLPQLSQEVDSSEIVRALERKLGIISRELGEIKGKLVSVAIGGDNYQTPDSQAIILESSGYKSILEELRREAEIRSEEIEEVRIAARDLRNEQGHDLSIVRELELAYITESKALFTHITTSLKNFLGKLYEEAEAELAEAGLVKPCTYSVIGLGSLALGQATPYSDFEFAIVTADNEYKVSSNLRINNYFRNLTHLVNFKMILLGETVIAGSKYGCDFGHLIHRGVSLDLGGKTPLGRIGNDKPYDLVGTHEWLLNYVRNEGGHASNKDKNLPYILENVCYICGDEDLVVEYQGRVDKFLHEPICTPTSAALEPAEALMVFSKHSVLLNYQSRALKVLKEGVVEIDYTRPESQNIPIVDRSVHVSGDLDRLRAFPVSGDTKLFNVKQEIYRLPDRLIYSLGMYYGICGDSIWDTIEQLSSIGVISEVGAINLTKASTFACMLRLNTYTHNKAQVENISLFTSWHARHVHRKETSTLDEQSLIFHLSSEDIKSDGDLFQYFYVTQPFHKVLSKFCNRHEKLSYNEKQGFFVTEIFFDSALKIKGLTHLRLAQYKEARADLEECLACEKHTSGGFIALDLKDRFLVRGALSAIYRAFQEYEKAAACIEYISTVLQMIYSKRGSAPDEATLLGHKAVIHRDRSEYQKAMKCYERILVLQEQSHGFQEHASIVATLNSIGEMASKLGEVEKSKDFLHRSLSMSESLNKGEPNLSIARVLSDLGSVYYNCTNYEVAEQFLERSLRMYEYVYHKEPNSKTAELSYYLGKAYLLQNKHKNAIDYFLQSLDIMQLLYGDNEHPYLQDCLESLTKAYIRCAEYSDVIDSKIAYYYHFQLNGISKEEFLLWVYSIEGAIEKIVSLLDCGEINANVKIIGSTALHNALGSYASDISLQILQILLEHGANPNLAMDNGSTPMHMAFNQGNIEAVRVLFQYDANINAQNCEGKTPLHYLLSNQEVELRTKIQIIQEFFSQFDLYLTNNEGETVVEVASENCPEVLWHLLGGAELDVESQGNQLLAQADGGAGLPPGLVQEQSHDVQSQTLGET